VAVEEFLITNKVYGIPFNIIYSKKLKNGAALPIILTYEDVVKAVTEAAQD
jgi:hypothetical protein